MSTAPRRVLQPEDHGLCPDELYRERTGLDVGPDTFRDVDAQPLPEPNQAGLVALRVYPETLASLRRVAYLLGTDLPEAVEYCVQAWDPSG